MTPVSLRTFLKQTLFLGAGLALRPPLLLAQNETEPGGSLQPARLLMDMVHNNPGEVPFKTHYNDAAFLKNLGYGIKVYELFEGAQFGIDWFSVDPSIFAHGTPERAWVDQKADELDKLYSSTKAAGLKVFCHTDMVVFPKKLVEKFQLKNFTQISDPDTQKYLRSAIQQMFSRFPQLDGLVIRIGETYLQGAPFHVGGVKDKANPEKTVIPLMNLLREEVCVNLGKTVVFRSWLSFDRSIPDYTKISSTVEPHPNLFLSVKHCEDDFHRGNPFSRVLGIGRHNQVVEVQCQREYEGKGAYPNYIAHGVIEGFEEHHNGESIRKIWANPLIAGMFTWSRGGGWKGPYITNELWCDVNAYVLSHWANNPNRTEESIFNDFATQVLHLTTADAALFRKLCLLSADAVYRGIRDTKNRISPWWTRDQYMGRPPLPSPEAIADFLEEKDEAYAMWGQIVSMARDIHFPNPATGEYAITSSLYGMWVYRIYRAGFHLAAIGPKGDKKEMKTWIDEYDGAWAEYRNLPKEHPASATLYEDKAFQDQPGIGAMVNELRKVYSDHVMDLYNSL